MAPELLLFGQGAFTGLQAPQLPSSPPPLLLSYIPGKTRRPPLLISTTGSQGTRRAWQDASERRGCGGSQRCRVRCRAVPLVEEQAEQMSETQGVKHSRVQRVDSFKEGRGHKKAALSRSNRLRANEVLASLGDKPLTSRLIAQALGKDEDSMGLGSPIRKRIAYQGGPGAFSEALAQEVCPEMKAMPCEDNEAAFQALEGFMADRALLPVENSVSGSIHEVLDLLLRYDVHIVDEVFLNVELCLVALPGTKREDIRRVLSDTASLQQCENFIRDLPGSVRREAVGDTAGAAQTVAENQLRDTAAIASTRAAELYDLEVLDHNIQDNKENITRFFILSRDAVRVPTSTVPHKTSVVFSFPERPGQLFNALSAFALRDLDLTKIESRPFRDDPIVANNGSDNGPGPRFQYRFYIDILGSLADPVLVKAIRHLQEIAPFMRVLGCFPRDTSCAPSPIVDTPIAEEYQQQLEQDSSKSTAALGSAILGGVKSNESLLMAVMAASSRPGNQNGDRPQLDKLGVAFQGMPGAYSESAVLKAFPDCQPQPCERFEDAFQSLSQWQSDYAVLPVENSLGGSIHAVYDLLIRYKLHIVGEVTVKVNHCLLALPGVQKGDLRRVISHYQALAQVEDYTRRLPGVVREAVDDTAGAARMIAQNNWRDTAAVASARAGELYSLNALDTHIQDNQNNVTRFLVLAREPKTQDASDPSLFKTSIVFSLREGPGQLFKACAVFALRGIDMTKIESRPMRVKDSVTPADGSFRYLFYMDLVTSMADENGQNALQHLAELAVFLRVLGCYPMAQE